MLPEKEDIYSIFNIVKNLNDSERKYIKDESKYFDFRGRKKLTWLPIASYIVSLILALLSKSFNINPLFSISLWLLFISYLLVALSLCIIVFWDSLNF
jgi:hypothetical protein